MKKESVLLCAAFFTVACWVIGTAVILHYHPVLKDDERFVAACMAPIPLVFIGSSIHSLYTGSIHSRGWRLTRAETPVRFYSWLAYVFLFSGFFVFALSRAFLGQHR